MNIGIEESMLGGVEDIIRNNIYKMGCQENFTINGQKHN